ncbi:MAG: RDD family protein [Anaerolineae bacterium]|nr:RDD family protein [Anaerolineae bacterium]
MSDHIYDDTETYVEEKPKRKVRDVDTYELADIGNRLIALIIDGFILSTITGILFGAAKGPGFGVGLVVGVAFHWYFLTRMNGQTPGAMLMKIRIIKTDGTKLQDADAIVRQVATYLSSAIMGLGYFWALWDDKRQTWHDKIANTYVVKAE